MLSKLKEKLIKNSVYVITVGSDFWRPKKLLQTCLKFYDLVNDNWYSFVYENKEKVISLPHFITTDEVNLGNKERDIDVSARCKILL